LPLRQRAEDEDLGHTHLRFLFRVGWGWKRFSPGRAPGEREGQETRDEGEGQELDGRSSHGGHLSRLCGRRGLDGRAARTSAGAEPAHVCPWCLLCRGVTERRRLVGPGRVARPPPPIAAATAFVLLR